MAAPVYSVRFGEYQSSGTGSHDLYTVPAGMVAIVRCVTLVSRAAGSGCRLYRTGGQSWASAVGLANDELRVLDLRSVFAAGETFGVTWIAGDVRVVVNGYLLTA